MREKEPASSVRSKPDGSLVIVRADGREEPYAPAASDLSRIDATTDEDIARQIASDPDVAPELTEEWFERADVMEGNKVIRRGRPRLDAVKHLVTLRLDPDVLERLRAGGPGWQSRLNDAMRKHLRLGKRRLDVVESALRPDPNRANKAVRRDETKRSKRAPAGSTGASTRPKTT